MDKSIPYSCVFLHGKEIIIRVLKGLAKKGTTAKELHKTAVWGEIQRQAKSIIFLCQQFLFVSVPCNALRNKAWDSPYFSIYWQEYFLIPCHIPEPFSPPTVWRLSIPKQTQAIRKALWPNPTRHRKGGSSESIKRCPHLKWPFWSLLEGGRHF